VVKGKMQEQIGGLVSKYFKGQYKRPFFAVLTVFLVLASRSVVHANTLIAESYVATEKMPVGAIVSLKKNTTNKVEPASTDNAIYLIGAIIDSSNSQLTLSSNEANQVHVATSGVEPVLISDINGPLAVGDPITPSPIKGIGMKATDNVKIIGVAQEAFPNGSASKTTAKDKKGQSIELKAGQISALINVSYYYKQPDKTLIPPAIQNIANALAGKKVNTLPILISIGIFIMAMIVVMSIVYSMIHSSIISVGRNPMSQAAVYRNVIQLSTLVIVIMAVAVGAIFMILAKL
jgi:hypothetical protein